MEFELDDAVAILERTPRVVRELLGRVTLRQLLSTWAVHDLGHLAQISRTMAKRYREQVGPWRAYLPVLDSRDGTA
jgi:hypothetical protein